MMLISIFTPTHRNGEYLKETWESLKEQTYPYWEWIIVPNGGGIVPDEILSDPRVRICPANHLQPISGERYSIGALKRFACGNCDGQVYLELDDDDLLTPNALEVVYKEFNDPETKMVYSNTAEFSDKTWVSRTFSEYWGWKARPFEYKGHQLMENVAWPPSPHAFRHIFWSPNHLRAWRSDAYWEVGGHDPNMPLVDDHDLNLRFYLQYGKKGVKFIDETLYLYRIHEGSTCLNFSNEIQVQDMRMYDERIIPLAERWAKDEGLLKIDLGGAFNAPAGYMTVDLRDECDIKCDLNGEWPFGDGKVGIVRAFHIFEHLSDPIHTMNELYRVLAPGGFAFIEVPSTDGRGAWQDPTHCSYWNENSFFYYTRHDQARFIQPKSKARFQESLLINHYPNKWYEENKIPCVLAHLICLKPGYEERRAGEIRI